MAHLLVFRCDIILKFVLGIGSASRAFFSSGRTTCEEEDTEKMQTNEIQIVVRSIGKIAFMAPAVLITSLLFIASWIVMVNIITSSSCPSFVFAVGVPIIYIP